MSIETVFNWLWGKTKEYWQVPLFCGLFTVIIVLFVASIQNDWFHYTSNTTDISEWNLWFVFFIPFFTLWILTNISIEIHKRYMYRKYKNDRSIDIGKAISYYPTRDIRPSLLSEVSHAHTLYLLWRGVAAGQHAGLYRSGKIKKLLFISPEKNFDSKCDAYIRRSFPKFNAKIDANDLLHTVKREIVPNNISVRSLNELPPFLFIISNPFNNDGRIMIEECDLDKTAQELQTFIVDKEKQPYLFNILFNYYESLWNKGKERAWENLNEDTQIPISTEIKNFMENERNKYLCLRDCFVEGRYYQKDIVYEISTVVAENNPKSFKYVEGDK